MASKNRKKPAERKNKPSGKEPSYWIITAVVAIIFSVGLAAKVALVPEPVQIPKKRATTLQTFSRVEGAIDKQVLLVASNFSCACGGCGELPLVECTCDMERGAREEKIFIRNKLQEGATVDQVIQLVEQKYGYKTT